MGEGRVVLLFPLSVARRSRRQGLRARRALKSSNAATWGDIAETLARAGEDQAKGGERERHKAVRPAAPR